MSLRNRWLAEMPAWASMLNKFCKIAAAGCTAMLLYGATNKATLPMWIGIAGAVLSGLGSVTAKLQVKKADKDVK